MRKLTVFGLVLLFLVLIAIPPVNASASKISFIRKSVRCLDKGYGVDLSCDDSYHSIPAEAGASTTFIVTITNTGTFDDTYNVTACSIEDIICLVNDVPACFTPYPITLQAGKSTTFTVTAKLYSSSITGEWDVLIVARSQNDTSVSDHLVLVVNVLKPGPNVTIILPKGISTFEFTIKNTGTETLTNINWTVTFQYLGCIGGRISGYISGLELPPGEMLTIPLHMFGFGPGKVEVTVNTDQVSKTVSTRVFFLGLFAYFY
jgi:uncharacterized membrane protein